MDDKGRHGRCGGERHHRGVGHPGRQGKNGCHPLRRKTGGRQDSGDCGYGEQLYGACGGAVQKGPGTGGGCPAAGDSLLQQGIPGGAGAPFYPSGGPCEHTHPFIQCAQPYRGNHTAGNLQDSVGTSQYTGDKGGQRQPVPDSQDSSPVRAGI